MWVYQTTYSLASTRSASPYRPHGSSAAPPRVPRAASSAGRTHPSARARAPRGRRRSRRQEASRGERLSTGTHTTRHVFVRIRPRAKEKRARRHIFTTTRVARGTARGPFSHQQPNPSESRRRGRAPPGRAPRRATPASTTANQLRYPRAAAAPPTVSTSCRDRATRGCGASPSRARPESAPCGFASPAAARRCANASYPARAARGVCTPPTRGRPRRRRLLRIPTAHVFAARLARPRPTRR